MKKIVTGMRCNAITLSVSESAIGVITHSVVLPWDSQLIQRTDGQSRVSPFVVLSRVMLFYGVGGWISHQLLGHWITAKA